MFTLLAGFAMMTDSAEREERTYDRDHMDTMLIIVNSLSFFALFVSILLMLPCCRKRVARRNEKAARQAAKVVPQVTDEEDAQALRSWTTPAEAVKPGAGVAESDSE